MTFHSVEHALRFYFERITRFDTPRALPLHPRDADNPSAPRDLADFHAEVMTVAACLRGLDPWELLVLRLTYREKMSLSGIRGELRRFWPDGVVWNPYRRSTARFYSNTWIARVREGAEGKVARQLDRRGLLNGDPSMLDI